MDHLGGITAVSFNDANYSYTVTYNNLSQTLTDEGLTEMCLQINQNGTKLKSSGAICTKVVQHK